MRLKITTWNGHNINDVTNYEAVISPGNAMPSAVANFLDLGQTNPIYAGKTISGGYFTFFILARGTIETQRDTLNEWFSVTDSDAGILVAQDLDNSNHEWYLEGYPVTPPTSDNKPAQFAITLALKQPYWIENVENSTVWSVTSDTETQDIDNIGNVEALPIFEVKPKTIKSGSLPWYFVGIKHSDWGTISPTNTVPVDLTPSGVNTSALVGGGTMQADGDDIVVTIDGVTAYRWLVGMNTTTTHIWANVPLAAAPSMTLYDALDGSTTPASFRCSFTAATITLPPSGILQIGTEFITYSSHSVDTSTKLVTFVPSARNAKGSTIAAHSSSTAVYWIQHDIWISYGNLSAAAPVQDDGHRPAFDLSASTNAIWDYPDFSNMPGYYGFSAPRFMGAAKWYTDEDNDAMVDPYEVFGLQLESVLQGNVVYQLNVWGRVAQSHPGGISRLVCNAEKWRSSANYGTLTFVVGGTSQTVASPSVASTYEAVAIDITTTAPSTSAYCDFRGVLGTTLPVPKARVQIFDWYIEIDSPPEITLILQSGSVAYTLDFSMENTENSYGFYMPNVSTRLNEVTYIDCNDMEVYRADGNNLRGQLFFTGDRRDEWLTLLPGVNTLSYTETDVAQTEITVKWRARNTI